ncbi:hypothetical protein [Aequorivita lipolytica]|uniref:Uncharacterized protein n=1 Tax=Aequorivita lipolytica TaxID=153267 RepID=A0A5C6YKV4_9FLAO|nr:hypothetical protein [Aequorivita lipolytica]TXD67869.1 hypothetical protein ESV24_14800 [Aequorivita lipolytica]SRX51205.1 hypothetical protein AEQU2_01685 [Aequorivita lipolytica]
MKSIKQKLHRAIKRSQAAYNLYTPDKKYYQALRIKLANEKVYELLEVFLYECDEKEVDLIHQYLFHLEDWFHQFETLEKKLIDLEAEFVFNRFDESPEFPESILKSL